MRSLGTASRRTSASVRADTRICTHARTQAHGSRRSDHTYHAPTGVLTVLLCSIHRAAMCRSVLRCQARAVAGGGRVHRGRSGSTHAQHTHTHTRTHAHTNTHTHTHRRAHTHTPMYTHTTRTSIHARTHSRTHARPQAYDYDHTHTQINTRPRPHDPMRACADSCARWTASRPHAHAVQRTRRATSIGGLLIRWSGMAWGG